MQEEQKDLILKATDLLICFLKKKNKAFFNRLTILSFLEKPVENKQKNEEINVKYSYVLTALSDFLS